MGADAASQSFQATAYQYLAAITHKLDTEPVTVARHHSGAHIDHVASQAHPSSPWPVQQGPLVAGIEDGSFLRQIREFFPERTRRSNSSTALPGHQRHIDSNRFDSSSTGSIPRTGVRFYKLSHFSNCPQIKPFHSIDRFGGLKAMTRFQELCTQHNDRGFRAEGHSTAEGILFLDWWF
ncbi:hypothetical protein FBEOM_2404 [Fusarium beomiforme]|uniref:Uncharacterized protein n=1 Tax=Fusarium beomiforme TaxID=44412 RepID=A0A9P5E2I2_9HYPO|nr:hypothetical protein FBEOM_2404 [Fusarium beomiforme]